MPFLNLPAEQAVGLAELITECSGYTGHPNARVLVTVGDRGLTAAPLTVAFTVGATNLATYEVSPAGTADEV